MGWTCVCALVTKNGGVEVIPSIANFVIRWKSAVRSLHRKIYSLGKTASTHYEFHYRPGHVLEEKSLAHVGNRIQGHPGHSLVTVPTEVSERR